MPGICVRCHISSRWCLGCALCESCHDATMGECENCRGCVPLQDRIDGLCEDCSVLTPCSECGYRDPDACPDCERCRQCHRTISRCIDCNGCFNLEDLDADERCEWCSEEYGSEDEPYRLRYRGKVRKPALLDEHDPIFSAGLVSLTASVVFGVELEVETPSLASSEIDTLAYTLESLHPNVVCTSDSTIQHGLEVRLGPVARKYHREIWPQVFQTIKRFDENASCWKYSNLGLHVHLDSRTWLDELAMERTMAMVYALPSDLSKWIFGRNPKGLYSIWHNPYNDRYSWINATHPHDADCPTVEFRGGKASLNLDRILWLLDFCLAMACAGNAQCRDLDDTFRFIEQHAELWPAFLNRLRKHGKYVVDGWRGFTDGPLAEYFPWRCSIVHRPRDLWGTE